MPTAVVDTSQKNIPTHLESDLDFRKVSDKETTSEIKQAAKKAHQTPPSDFIDIR